MSKTPHLTLYRDIAHYYKHNDNPPAQHPYKSRFLTAIQNYLEGDYVTRAETKTVRSQPPTGDFSHSAFDGLRQYMYEPSRGRK